MMNKDKVIRVCWASALALLGAVILIRSAVLIGTPLNRLTDVVDYICDDGYYYLGIAANLAEHGRSTLDGISFTNGYQPLWLLVLAGFAKLVGTLPRGLFIAACLLVYAIAIGGIAFSPGSVRIPRRHVALCLCAGLALIPIRWPEVFLEGMEPILLLPLMVPLVIVMERFSAVRDQYLLSLLLAIAFLVRLDLLSLYAAAIIVVPFLWLRIGVNRGAFPAYLRIVARLSTFVVPTVVLYLAVNYWLFDTPVPVSGLIKSMGPKFSNWGMADTFFAPARASLFLLAVLLPLEWLARRQARPEPIFYRSFTIVALATLIQGLYFCTQFTWNVLPWYECLVATAVALVVARIIYLSSLLMEKPKIWAAGAAVLAIVAVWGAHAGAVLAVRSLPHHLQADMRRAAGMKALRIGEVNDSPSTLSLSMVEQFFDPKRRTLVAMGDYAGGLAFWGRQSIDVVQLEGLTLDVKYFRALRDGHSEQDVVARFPVDYLVVDREYVPVIRKSDGQMQYVVPDPVRGRVTNGPVAIFCFPKSALRFDKTYPSYYASNTRLAFTFAERESCDPKATLLVRSVEKGIGLQQFSYPGEYDLKGGGFVSKAVEDRDRHSHAAQL